MGFWPIRACAGSYQYYKTWLCTAVLIANGISTCIYVVGQNEIQVKMKFWGLLTLIIHGSWIIRVRKQRKLRIKLG